MTRKSALEELKLKREKLESKGLQTTMDTFMVLAPKKRTMAEEVVYYTDVDDLFESPKTVKKRKVYSKTSSELDRHPIRVREKIPVGQGLGREKENHVDPPMTRDHSPMTRGHSPIRGEEDQVGDLEFDRGFSIFEQKLAAKKPSRERFAHRMKPYVSSIHSSDFDPVISIDLTRDDDDSSLKTVLETPIKEKGSKLTSDEVKSTSHILNSDEIKSIRSNLTLPDLKLSSKLNEEDIELTPPPVLSQGTIDQKVKELTSKFTPSDKPSSPKSKFNKNDFLKNRKVIKVDWSDEDEPVLNRRASTGTSLVPKGKEPLKGKDTLKRQARRKTLNGPLIDLTREERPMTAKPSSEFDHEDDLFPYDDPLDDPDAIEEFEDIHGESMDYFDEQSTDHHENGIGEPSISTDYFKDATNMTNYANQFGDYENPKAKRRKSETSKKRPSFSRGRGGSIYRGRGFKSGSSSRGSSSRGGRGQPYRKPL